jgi:hypothetical protein
LIQLLKNGFKETPKRKKNIIYKIWIFVASISPFIAIVISAHMAYLISRSNNYFDVTLKFPHHYDGWAFSNKLLVGKVPAGLGFLKSPNFKFPMAEMFPEAVPVALVSRYSIVILSMVNYKPLMSG